MGRKMGDTCFSFGGLCGNLFWIQFVKLTFCLEDCRYNKNHWDLFDKVMGSLSSEIGNVTWLLKKISQFDISHPERTLTYRIFTNKR